MNNREKHHHATVLCIGMLLSLSALPASAAQAPLQVAPGQSTSVVIRENNLLNARYARVQHNTANNFIRLGLAPVRGVPCAPAPQCVRLTVLAAPNTTPGLYKIELADVNKRSLGVLDLNVAKVGAAKSLPAQQSIINRPALPATAASFEIAPGETKSLYINNPAAANARKFQVLPAAGAAEFRVQLKPASGRACLPVTSCLEAVISASLKARPGTYTLNVADAANRRVGSGEIVVTARVRTSGVNTSLRDAVKNKAQLLANNRVPKAAMASLYLDYQAMEQARANGCYGAITNPNAPPPYIQTQLLGSSFRTGDTVVLRGDEIIPGQFRAAIGNAPLQLVSCTPTEITARWPTSTTGDLVVSHGTADSAYVLATNITTFDSSRVISISPSSFEAEDLVTLAGEGLTQLRPRSVPLSQTIVDSYKCDGNPPAGYVYQEYNGYCVKWSYGSPADFISLEIDGRLNTDKLVRVYDWSARPDGRSATFKAGVRYRQQQDSLGGLTRTPVEPQSGMSGLFRLGSNTPYTSASAFDSLGPSAAWNPTRLRLETAFSDFDRSQSVEFNQAFNFAFRDMPSPCQNCSLFLPMSIFLKGRDLLSSQLLIGNSLIANQVSGQTQLGGTFVPNVQLYFTNLSGDVISGLPKVEKNGQSSTGNTPFHILKFPRLVNAEYTGSQTWQANQEVTLNGWALRPTSVPNLTFQLRAVNSGSNSTSCHVNLEVREHSNNRIRVAFIPATSPRPANCSTSQQGWLALDVLYNGQIKQIWSIPFVIGGFG